MEILAKLWPLLAIAALVGLILWYSRRLKQSAAEGEASPDGIGASPPNYMDGPSGGGGGGD